MNRCDLIYLMACKFAKIAGSQAFMSLKKQDKDKLWFTDMMAEINDDAQNFARFDRSNLKALNQPAYADVIGDQPEDRAKFYLEHEKTQSLMNFILRSFQNYFPSKNPWYVYDHLKRDGLDYDESGYVSEQPVFILIHDLIHFVLQDEFLEQLEIQEDTGGANLLDEIYEDLASTMSNFQPRGYGRAYFAPFMARYLKRVFDGHMSGTPISEETLRDAIEATFRQAKGELRGKIDNIVLDDEYRARYEEASAASGKIKQLIDGMLSRYKHHMMENIGTAMGNYDSGNVRFMTGQFDSIFAAFELDDLHEEYREKLQEADVINPADASALRAWMQTCLAEMGKVYTYFQNIDANEFNEEFGDEESEEDDEELTNQYDDIEEEDEVPSSK